MIALHNLDIPWRPSDLEQRLGRPLRQGNQNEEVGIYNYVTESTFDAYMWSIQENKQRFISQIMTSKTVVRSCEDIDETVLSYAEIKAIATGDPRIKEKMEVDMEVMRLQTLQSAYNSQKFALQDKITFILPKEIEKEKSMIDCLKKDIEQRNMSRSEKFIMSIGGKIYDERRKAGERILLFLKEKQSKEEIHIGTFAGFEIYLFINTWGDPKLALKHCYDHVVDLGDNDIGNIFRIENTLKEMEQVLTRHQERLKAAQSNLEQASLEMKKPFAHSEELQYLMKRKAELEEILDLEKREEVIADDEEDEEMEAAM